ncbi:anthranilate synthase [candidate division TA06 bacterium DG_24]|uniref:Anthranilate synthase component 1 n=1 Tax=candidate division TA06 bacterium DG_24 TaxID=1703770 RepID=A0A0S7WN59_UNCT6|nr:MAG: anthranilate synthase [candidate division TA06 bacterium DG_24]
MYYPALADFREKAREGNLVPVWKEVLLDQETPVSAFRKIGTSQYAFLLESVEGGENVGRHSFVGSEPFAVFSSRGDEVTVTRDGRQHTRSLAPGEDPLTALKALLSEYKFVPVEGLPRFCGGAVGFMGYDTVRFFERLPGGPVDDLGLPDNVFVLTDTCLIFDHVYHRGKVVSNAIVNGDPDQAYEGAIRKIEALCARLNAPAPAVLPPRPRPKDTKLTPNLTREDYEAAVLRAKDYIAAGDVIQVVVSQRLSRAVAADAFDIYRSLRSVNPSPYMYFLTYGDLRIVGSSPERLVSVEDGEVITRPIAGSRPRGKTPEEDEALAAELLADEKERAEHLMLLDLGRNDLGRVCRYGTVRVDEQMVIEKYSHVQHIVSNVRGELRPDRDQYDVLRACFPAGTLTGAPKVRAMEIIDELEPTRRGPYGGVIGYLSFSGNMDTAITIRTIVCANGVAHMQLGAGIVADSIPAREYEECVVLKGGALLRAIEMAEAGLE